MSRQERPRVRNYQVPQDRDGQRLDNLLSGLLKGVPRRWIYRAIRKGEVRVNGSRCKPMQKVQAGDRVRIPPVSVAGDGTRARVPPAVVERLRGAILYRDDELLAVDKPTGLAVHGGSGLAWGVIDALREIPELGPLELVHRLDRETSGCLLLARSHTALRRINRLLAAGEVDKRYLTLVKGRLEQPTVVDAELDVDALQDGERHVRTASAGKAAVSRFQPLQAGPDWTYCQVRIDTGRTHQIRAHARHMGHPLAGDSRYGDEAFNARLNALGLRRTFLHCAEMAFELDGRERHLHAPLADDLAAVLEQLQDSLEEADPDLA